MGYFKNIDLYNFRNFKQFKLEFSKNCNVLYGKNGSGKTNLLESISLFSKGRGLKKDSLLNIINKNSNKFVIKSEFYNDEIIYHLLSETYESNLRKNKILYVNNDKSLETLDKLYKMAPFLFFLPETERLFISSPNYRRNFIDRFIYSYNNQYNKLINRYNKNIIERSKLLNSEYYDHNWLDEIEKNIAKFGLEIYISRKNQISSIIKYLNYFINEFKLTMSITSNLYDKYFDKINSEEHFIYELKENRNIDTKSGGSKIGPHKSDYQFVVNDNFLASQLSTGQQKTLILLIYLSQCKHLLEDFNIKPILLLDEVCSHLDKINRKILLSLIESFNLQIFMTGTNKNLFSFLSTNTNFCNIVN